MTAATPFHEPSTPAMDEARRLDAIDAENESRDEAEWEERIRERKAAMTCPECGERGRIAEWRDSPSGTPINDGGEWLETNDGLTICDACGHRWWVD